MRVTREPRQLLRLGKGENELTVIHEADSPCFGRVLADVLERNQDRLIPSNTTYGKELLPVGFPLLRAEHERDMNRVSRRLDVPLADVSTTQ